MGEEKITKIITVIRKTTFSTYVRCLMRKKQVQTLILARPSRHSRPSEAAALLSMGP